MSGMITSVNNERVRHIIRLRDKAKARREEDCFLVEGPRMAQELPEERLIEAYVSESFVSDPDRREMAERLRAIPVSDAVMAAMSDTKTPQGVLAVVRRKNVCARDIWSAKDALVVVLERLQDPGNLGTILRTAEGAGVTGVIFSADTADLYSPKTIRSTMGSIYRVPAAESADLAAETAAMRRAGVRVFAAHLAGSVFYDEEDYTGPTAFLIGNEGAGLSRGLAALSDRRVRIPMAGQVESLNAAVSAALLMYEAGRQRRVQK